MSALDMCGELLIVGDGTTYQGSALSCVGWQEINSTDSSIDSKKETSSRRYRVPKYVVFVLV